MSDTIKELSIKLKQAARDYEAAIDAESIDGLALLVASKALQECEREFVIAIRKQASGKLND
jgi:hypothetical protein